METMTANNARKFVKELVKVVNKVLGVSGSLNKQLAGIGPAIYWVPCNITFDDETMVFQGTLPSNLTDELVNKVTKLNIKLDSVVRTGEEIKIIFLLPWSFPLNVPNTYLVGPAVVEKLKL